MGAVANEPSMEDILSSIKRIIADGSDRTPPARAAKRRPVVVSDEDAQAANSDAGEDAAPGPVADDEEESTILELTEAVADEPSEPGEPVAAPKPVAAAQSGTGKAGIISDSSALAARQSLSHLSALLIRPEDGESNTLEGLVREMLKPMLKAWLDERLPDLVEAMVKKEIDRITGRLG